MRLDDLRKVVERKPGIVLRPDRARAEQALSELDIPLDSEFAEFFLEYMIELFVSPVSDESICDVSEPSCEVMAGTEFVHEVWGLPEQFICFTTVEGEGGYLYDRTTGSVWDFSLATRDAFVNGCERPRWQSFFEFMAWYLG
jgi:hypothetical protein